jgi:multiple sugar transport system ATP-binding protein
MAKVTYKNVTKRFGTFEAVKSLDIEINDREFLCLVGPSGCGKTTSLRMLAGLDTISEGEIVIGEKVVNGIEPKERGIAMVFQSYALYPHYNVYDNLAFGLRAKSNRSINIAITAIIWVLYGAFIAALWGLGLLFNLILPELGRMIFIGSIVSFFATILLFGEVRKAISNKITMILSKFWSAVSRFIQDEKNIEEKVLETAKLLEIEEQLYKKPRQLSGGQRQRVALGRAIIRNPQVFLLDEPLSNLDAKLRVQMRAELQRLSQRLGVTTLYVTHDQVEAMTLGHRIAIMNKGVLQQVGTPKEVYLKPYNRFVAGFIGSPPMNFTDGKIKESSDGLYFFGEKLEYKIPDRYKSLEKYIGKEVILGIRPEHIGINVDIGAPNKYDVKVGVVEPIGSDTYLYIDFPTEYVMIAKMEGISNLGIDEEVKVSFNPRQIHFFDKESTLRILPSDE